MESGDNERMSGSREGTQHGMNQYGPVAFANGQGTCFPHQAVTGRDETAKTHPWDYCVVNRPTRFSNANSIICGNIPQETHYQGETPVSEHGKPKPREGGTYPNRFATWVEKTVSTEPEVVQNLWKV